MTGDDNQAKRGKAPREYRDTPQQFIAPTEAELKARNKRNAAIAISLALFMLFVFVTMITRAN
jgi:hypothetical protein